jgi:hypothetical protein
LGELNIYTFKLGSYAIAYDSILSDSGELESSDGGILAGCSGDSTGGGVDI